MAEGQPPDAQPINAFEAALERLAYKMNWHAGRTVADEERALFDNLRAARFLPVTDETLDRALSLFAKDCLDGPRNLRIPLRYTSADNIRTLVAAALQQHPTGCYSREAVFEMLMEFGRFVDEKRDVPLGAYRAKADIILAEHDAQQEEGKP